MARVEILTVGDELVEGRLVDTNAASIADALARLGRPAAQHVTVGDSIPEIVAAIRAGIERCRTIVITGGLGPTRDDLTSAAVAQALERPLERSAEAMCHLDHVFASRSLPMSPNNAKQADLPAGATIIANPRGTAVGFFVDAGECRIYVLPGVPHEMLGMLDEQVLPDIAQRLPGRPPLLATLKCFGLPESEVGQRLQDLGSRVAEPARLWIQYRAALPEIHVRLVLDDAEDGTLDALLDEARSRLGRAVFASGRGDIKGGLADVVVARLSRDRARLGLADALCGGLPARLLVATGGDVEVLAGALVAPTRHGLARLLDLAPGSSVAELAEAIADRHDAGLGAAIVPGPDGAVELAVVHPGPDGAQGQTRQLHLPFDRPRVQLLGAHALLELVRRGLDAPADRDPRYHSPAAGIAGAGPR